MFLVLGLGNPGPRYVATRHNIGFRAADALAEKLGFRLDQHRYHAACGSGETDGARIMIAKPLTYMNESGRSAAALLDALRIPTQNLIVVHDDIDLPVGKIRVKHKGGHAGQRGVASIIEHLGTDLFSRVRIGVGRPRNRDEIVEYVLSPFETEELDLIADTLDATVATIEKTLTELRNKTGEVNK